MLCLHTLWVLLPRDSAVLVFTVVFAGADLRHWMMCASAKNSHRNVYSSKGFKLYYLHLHFIRVSGETTDPLQTDCGMRRPNLYEIVQCDWWIRGWLAYLDQSSTHNISVSLLTKHSAERDDWTDDGEEDKEDWRQALHLERISDVTQVVRISVLYVVDEAAEYSNSNNTRTEYAMEHPGPLWRHITFN